MQARELVNVPVSKPDGLHSIPGTMWKVKEEPVPGPSSLHTHEFTSLIYTQWWIKILIKKKHLAWYFSLHPELLDRCESTLHAPHGGQSCQSQSELSISTITEATSSRSHQVESWDERAISEQRAVSWVRGMDSSSRGSHYSDSNSLSQEPGSFSCTVEAKSPEVAENSELHKTPPTRSADLGHTNREEGTKYCYTELGVLVPLPCWGLSIQVTEKNVINITERAPSHPLIKGYRAGRERRQVEIQRRKSLPDFWLMNAEWPGEVVFHLFKWTYVKYLTHYLMGNQGTVLKLPRCLRCSPVGRVPASHACRAPGCRRRWHTPVTAARRKQKFPAAFFNTVSWKPGWAIRYLVSIKINKQISK